MFYEEVLLAALQSGNTYLKVGTDVRLWVMLGVGRICKLIQETVKDIHEALYQVEISSWGDSLLHIRLTPLQLEPKEMFSDEGEEWRYKAVEEGSKDSLVLLCEGLREFC